MPDSPTTESTNKELRKSFETTDEMRRLIDVVEAGGAAFRRLIYHPHDADPKENNDGYNLASWWNRLAHSSASCSARDTDAVKHEPDTTADTIAAHLWHLVDTDAAIDAEYGIGPLIPFRSTGTHEFGTQRDDTCRPVAEGLLAAESLLYDNAGLLADVVETTRIVAGHLMTKKTPEAMETASLLNDTFTDPDYLLRLLRYLAYLHVRLLSSGPCGVGKLATYLELQLDELPSAERSQGIRPSVYTTVKGYSTNKGRRPLAEARPTDINKIWFKAPTPFVHWIQIIIEELADPLAQNMQVQTLSSDSVDPSGQPEEYAAAAEILKRRTSVLAAGLYLWIDDRDVQNARRSSGTRQAPNRAELGRLALVNYMEKLHTQGFLGQFHDNDDHRECIIDLLLSPGFLATWCSDADPPRFTNDYARQCVRRAVGAFYKQCRELCRELAPDIAMGFDSK